MGLIPSFSLQNNWHQTVSDKPFSTDPAVDSLNQWIRLSI